MRTVTGTISRLSEHCKLPLAVRRPVVEARARLRLQIEACKIHFLQSLGGGGEGTQTCLVHLLARPVRPPWVQGQGQVDPTTRLNLPTSHFQVWWRWADAEAIGVRDEQARFKED